MLFKLLKKARLGSSMDNNEHSHDRTTLHNHLNNSDAQDKSEFSTPSQSSQAEASLDQLHPLCPLHILTAHVRNLAHE